MKKQYKKMLELEARLVKGAVLECRTCGAEFRDLADALKHTIKMHQERMEKLKDNERAGSSTRKSKVRS